MGRKKSPVTRNKHIDRRYVASSTSGSSSSASNVSELPDDVLSSSLRGLATINQRATEMDTEFAFQLPSIQRLHTALLFGKENAKQGKKKQRKRRSSGDDVVGCRQEESGESSYHESQEVVEEEEMVTISVSELEKWQQRVIFHVENHFTNEQLKRIAEFGRVHGSIVQEAKQFVSNMEIQLANQLEEERTLLRAQAEEFVTKTATENESLQQQVNDLTQQVERLEKKAELLERQVDVLESEKAQKFQDKRHCETCEQVSQIHFSLNDRTQVQLDSKAMNKAVENRPNNEYLNTNDYGNGNTSLPQPVKQIAHEQVKRCCPSSSTDLTPDRSLHCEKDQLLPQQHQRLQSLCSVVSPPPCKQSDPKRIELSKPPAGTGGLQIAGDG